MVASPRIARGPSGAASADRLWLAAGLFLVVSLASSACLADPVRGEATLSVSGGYARLVVKLNEDVEFEINTAWFIVVIRFKQPIDVPVEKLSDVAPDYVGSARRDPDGMAIRLALSRKVTINSMAAGERLFVDLLPDTWKGLPPNLPPEVIRELARPRQGRGAGAADPAGDRRGDEAAADPGSRLGAADLRALRLRIARRHRRQSTVLRDQKTLALKVQLGAELRSGGRQAGGAVEHRLDQPEDFRRRIPRRSKSR